jgi:hypothetical protein
MPDLKISALPAATTPLAGTEEAPIVQGGTTDRVTVANLTAGRAVGGLSFTSTGGTVTASAPIFNGTQTWNNAGVTFTGALINVTDTASAAGSRLFSLQVGGADRFHVTKAGAGHFAFSVRAQSNSAVISLGASDDTILAWDAANTLAQRNGVNAQAFNIYNTYTSGSVYERATMGWAGNFYKIFTNSASGTARGLRFGTDNTDRWEIGATTGHFVPVADNAYNIGGPSNRPAIVYGVNFIGSGDLTLAGAGGVYFLTRSGITSPSDGAVRIANNAGSQSFTITAGAANLATFNGAVTGTGNLTAGSGGNVIAGGSVYTANNTVAALPSAVGQTGARRFVTNALAPVFGSAVVGGGAVNVPVYSDGTNWIVG